MHFASVVNTEASFPNTDMKLRIHDNSIRLRLTDDDVRRFQSEGSIESSLDFGTDRFIFRLVADPSSRSTTAELATNLIAVHVPAGEAREWAESETLAIEGGTMPRIIVEKELSCLHKKRSADTAASGTA